MLKLSSRSATVLVIFSVAVIAFCLATVFAAMTGPISILPNESDSEGILDNLSMLSDSDNGNYQSYSDDSYDYSSGYSESHTDEPQVETTTDTSDDDNSKTADGSGKEETNTHSNNNEPSTGNNERN